MTARAQMTDSIAAFQMDMHTLAKEIVGTVLRAEIERRKADRRELGPAVAAEAESLGLYQLGPVDVSPETAARIDERIAAAEPTRRKRRSIIDDWPRERIIEDLAGMLLRKEPTDYAWVAVRGPRGLAKAARHVFGRYDAALNVANLRIAERYPNGVPERRVLPVLATEQSP